MYSFSLCGLNVSCGAYFNQMPYLTTFTAQNIGFFRVNSGYNRINLDIPIQVSKGSMIFVNTNQTALLINTLDTSLYSDYLVRQNVLSPIVMFKRYKFYFNCLISDKYYVSTFKFSHTYSNTGDYEVKATLSSNNLAAKQWVNISSGRLFYIIVNNLYGLSKFILLKINQ